MERAEWYNFVEQEFDNKSDKAPNAVEFFLCFTIECYWRAV